MGLGIQSFNLARPYIPVDGPIGKDANGDNIYASNANWAFNFFYELNKGAMSVGAVTARLKWIATKSKTATWQTFAINYLLMFGQASVGWLKDNPAPNGMLRDYTLAVGHSVDEANRIYLKPDANSVTENLQSTVYNSGVGVYTMLSSLMDRALDPELGRLRSEGVYEWMFGREALEEGNARSDAVYR